MKVLVAGGAGYIGSHAVRTLVKAGHNVTILDDLSHGHRSAVERATSGLGKTAEFVDGNVADRDAVTRLLRDRGIEAVMHFAAYIEVGESVQDPEKYYRNNFCGSLSLLQSMREASVSKLVFSSTAAVYGNPLSTPIIEDQPHAPINPYGKSKMMVELAIEDFASAYGLGYAILRYFNVAGASPDGVIGEAHEPESHLIPRILEAASGQTDAIGIYGTDYPTRDGTCVRDYIHVEDLVNAHVLALEHIRPRTGTAYNLGSEQGFTVREVIETCGRVTGRNIQVVEKPRRAGDPPVLIASSAKIREQLGWQRQYPDLEAIVRHAWNWHQAGSALRKPV
ncbi:MAG: UDP-glucose 4-epimerase GalE [Acidobacteria bacterium]|nr:UDP-glucose 4-epimerase GalE [Acidobacteriota bacterium]